jgi:hypothetical protein
VSAQEVRLEDLLGRLVRSATGRPIGVIQGVRARPHGDEYLVHEILLGELGLKARLLGMLEQLPTFRALGLGRPYRTRPIPWQWLDLSDPEDVRFRRTGGRADGRTGGRGTVRR